MLKYVIAYFSEFLLMSIRGNGPLQAEEPTVSAFPVGLEFSRCTTFWLPVKLRFHYTPHYTLTTLLDQKMKYFW